MLAAFLIGVVRLYQWTIRPVIGAHCRFAPSCSEYAIESLQSHGAIRGTWLTIGRLLRCNPWSTGGYDPVPGYQNHACHPHTYHARAFQTQMGVLQRLKTGVSRRGMRL